MRVAHLEENQRVNTAGAQGLAPGVPVPGTAPDIKPDFTSAIAAPPRRKVLVIDDSSTIRRTAEIFLAQAGYQVMLAEDGFEALAKVGELHPDLVFCDILMPRLDGYQTCSLIKKSPRFHAIPVIMLSSRDGVFDRSRGRLVGAHDHLAKPFTRDALLQAVQTCLPCQPAGEALPA
ncbi:response regulator [Cupriavidus neocaledonicus]|uniref:Response regulator receiver, CheY family n=1 Tax=Cupriavidus neocaledonicus TaxID=1040979 RepID=A0A375H699_9BURK|nr:response regulator [Cupriavidus neocaledonicus]SOZ37210.1 putative response regulator receiver, CheY family [Cupriavidus neocaledonicus]SPD45789.1 Twitching motility two-component system response regulator PilG [Cupriavidus neocaledonicus]